MPNSGFFAFLAERRIDTKVGTVVALLHLSLIGCVLHWILFTQDIDPAWPMIWWMPIFLDVLVGLLWFAALALSRLLQLLPRFRTSRGEPVPIRSTFRRIPAYFWLALVPSVVAALFLVVALLRVEIHGVEIHRVDIPNFIRPLSVCGTLGTLACADLAARLTRALLRPIRKLPPLPPVA